MQIFICYLMHKWWCHVFFSSPRTALCFRRFNVTTCMQHVDNTLCWTNHQPRMRRRKLRWRTANLSVTIKTPGRKLPWWHVNRQVLATWRRGLRSAGAGGKEVKRSVLADWLSFVFHWKVVDMYSNNYLANIYSGKSHNFTLIKLMKGLNILTYTCVKSLKIVDSQDLISKEKKLWLFLYKTCTIDGQSVDLSTPWIPSHISKRRSSIYIIDQLLP